MGMTIGFIVGGICAVACYQIATNRRRNPVLWGFLGFLFGLIALIILLVIGEGDYKQS